MVSTHAVAKQKTPRRTTPPFAKWSLLTTRCPSTWAEVLGECGGRRTAGRNDAHYRENYTDSGVKA